jgi:hypothetical protein
MSEQAWWLVLLSVATTLNGVIAGASLDQSIEQLPARHRIGMRAYRSYSRASHMANGRYWLIPLGIVGPLFTLVAAIWVGALNLQTTRWLPVVLAAALSILYSISSVFAIRANWPIAPWSRNPAPDDEQVLAGIFRRFERRQAIRALLQFATFIASVWALALNSTSPS